MRRSRRTRAFLWSIVLPSVTWALPASAAPIVNETFTDGNKEAGTDNSGAVWYDRSANTTLTVVDDSAGIGTGNALRLNIPGGSQINRPTVGLFNVYTLSATPGDGLVLTFDFRYAATPAGAADGFRFGLYNNNGTPQAADDGTGVDNDFGYLASIGTGGTDGLQIYKEAANSSGAGDTGNGGDRASLSPSVVSTLSITDTAKHSASFSVIRSATGVDLSVTVDGVLRGTASDATSPYLTFHEILLSYATPQAYLIDNVTLNSVPEPASAGLAALAALGVLGRRRRRVR